MTNEWLHRIGASLDARDGIAAKRPILKIYLSSVMLTRLRRQEQNRAYKVLLNFV